MAVHSQIGFHPYVGQYDSDQSCIAFLAAASLLDGGQPPVGVTYFNSTYGELRTYYGRWAALGKVIQWVFSEEGERVAFDGLSLYDVGRVAQQLSDGSLWILAGYSPAKWMVLSEGVRMDDVLISITGEHIVNEDGNLLV